MQAQRAPLQHDQIEDELREAFEALPLGQDELGCFGALPLIKLLEAQQVGIADDGGEGSPYLMGVASDETGLSLNHGLQMRNGFLLGGHRRSSRLRPRTDSRPC